MIWFICLLFLSALFIAVLWWKPGKVKALASQPMHFATELRQVSLESVHVKPERDAILDEEIDIIAKLIREEEYERRRQAALDRLAAVKSKSVS
jgi:hypothetical protein